MLTFAFILLCAILLSMAAKVPAFPEPTGPSQFGRNVNGRAILLSMAENVPAFPEPTGPSQFGRNGNGQYVYWITMVPLPPRLF